MNLNDGNVPLAIIAVHRSLAKHYRGEVLRGGCRRVDNFPVMLADSNIINGEVFVRRGVSEHQLSKRLNSRLVFDANSRGGFTDAAAVVLKTHCLVQMLEDEGFLRE